MIDPLLLLVPLLVLPIVLLFRFVGCGIDAVGTLVLPAPEYAQYILADPAAPPKGTVKHPEVKPNRDDVIAYWRLIDPDKINVSGDVKTTAPAKDSKLGPGGSPGHDGIYLTEPTAFVQFTSSSPGSEFTSGEFEFNKTSLIASDPTVTCRLFKGGHMVVPADDKLYPDQFTIEAWVWPQWGPNADTKFEHTLVTAGGHYRPPFDPSPSAGFHGFSIVADGTGHWQVRFPNVGDLFSSPPLVTHDKTHLAVTVAKEGALSRARLFVNGKEVLPPSNLVFYSPPKGSPLLIGVASTQSDPTVATIPTTPVISLIQELVLHRKALSANEIENHVDINRPN